MERGDPGRRFATRVDQSEDDGLVVVADHQLVGGSVPAQEVDQLELVIEASADQSADIAVGDLLGQGRGDHKPLVIADFGRAGGGVGRCQLLESSSSSNSSQIAQRVCCRFSMASWR